MKRFLELLMDKYGKYISKYTIFETMIPIRRQGIKHPEINKFKEFF
jgi:hypothetical protein